MIFPCLKAIFLRASRALLPHNSDNKLDPSNLPSDKPFLLIIDMDKRYTDRKSFPDTFKQKAQEFLKQNRDHFTVIHIRHDATPLRGVWPKKYEELSDSRGTVQQVLDASRYHDQYPITQPQSGEWVIGKHEYSTFKRTNLRESLPEDAELFIIGCYAHFCIKQTIKDALLAGYKVTALEDLILNQYSMSSKTQHEIDPRVIERTSESISEGPP